MKKISFVIRFILSLVFNVLIILNILSIYKLNILPTRYFIIGLIFLLIIDILLCYFLMKKVRKRKRIKRVITMILVFLLSIVLAFSYYYEKTTLSFFYVIDNTTQYSESVYYVVTQKDFAYESINDLSGKTIGLLKNGLSGQDDALDKLSKFKLNTISYDDNGLLSSALLSKSVDSILIEQAIYELLCETNDQFKNNVKVLYEKEIVIEEKKTEEKKKNIISTFDESLANKYGSYNIYVSGIDTDGSINKIARSDVNIIITVNPTTHKIAITHIPRDYYVQLRGTTGLKDKLTHSGYYGINTTVGTVEDLLKIKINYYVKVNFTSVISIVDMLGGIDVNSNYSFERGGYTFVKGINHLDGKAALAFSRERHSFKYGDRTRGKNQQAVLTAIIKKCMSPNILLNYSSLLEQANSFVKTNVSSNMITSIVNSQLNTNASWTFQTFNLDGEDSKGYSYSNPTDYNFIMIPDKKLLNDVSNKIKNICYGK